MVQAAARPVLTPTATFLPLHRVSVPATLIIIWSPLRVTAHPVIVPVKSAAVRRRTSALSVDTGLCFHRMVLVRAKGYCSCQVHLTALLVILSVMPEGVLPAKTSELHIIDIMIMSKSEIACVLEIGQPSGLLASTELMTWVCA